MNPPVEKEKILIVGDAALNRLVLAELLGEEFEILEAENGEQAISVLQKMAPQLSLVLLDIIMPDMDGFQVLEYMKQYHWLDEVPVIMISAESSSEAIHRAYELGATDYINRPFDAVVVQQRVRNTVNLFSRQRRLMGLVANQIYVRERDNNLMMSILSHVVEYRNGESGQHVLHIGAITELLLNRLTEKTDRYPLTREDISLISKAAAFHDVGKLSVPEEILNKPGSLTASEYEIMKRHTVVGAQMIENLPVHQNEPLVRWTYEIVRWHHERYDGGGYPDGLRGDQIPISAQAVSLADVYDALTSERCYKKAYSHEMAMRMILDGQCGVFNPLLLECLKDVENHIQPELCPNVAAPRLRDAYVKATEEVLELENLTAMEQSFRMLEIERKKSSFFLRQCPGMFFWYSRSPATLSLTAGDAEVLGMKETYVDPVKNSQLWSIAGERIMNRFVAAAGEITEQTSTVRFNLTMPVSGRPHICRCVMQGIWSSSSAEMIGIVGHILDMTRSMDQSDLLPEALESTGPPNQPDPAEKRLCLTGQQAWSLIHQLRKIYDMVRLVDSVRSHQYSINERGEILELPYACYSVWNRSFRCDNCVSARVMREKGRVARFDFLDNEMYLSFGVYVEVDGIPYVLEMASAMNDDTVVSGANQSRVLEYISGYDKKVYVDPLTDTYNRWYYKEQFQDKQKLRSAAMVDLDDFKSINDRFGHHAGDVALRAAAGVLKETLQDIATVIRMGGDEFAVLSLSNSEEHLRQAMEECERKIADLEIPDYPEIRLSISVGIVGGIGDTAKMLEEADVCLYQKKESKNLHRI